jgi:hypothetical protein
MSTELISPTGIEPVFTTPITATCLEDRTGYGDIATKTKYR